MKAMFCSMCAVLAAALGICLFSMWAQYKVLDTMDHLCGQAMTHVIAEDISGAMEYTHALNTTVEKHTRFMEMVASHDQLHEALASIKEAQVALECEDLDDAYQALAALEGTIEHLRDHETLSLANIC